MKSRGECRGCRGEGWLIAAALVFVLALSFAVHVLRLPEKETIVPVHAVDLERLRWAEMVNLNTDSVEKISRLPGVGMVLAERIVAYREACGPFASVEDLLRVEGIGEGKLEAVRSAIYVE